MKSTKPLGPKGVAVMLGLVLLLGFVGGLGSAFLSDRPGSMGFWATVTFTGVMMAAVLGVSVWWWRRLDEAAREAHKWAWYWGGSSGMLIGLVLMLTLTTRPADIAIPAGLGETPADLVGAGMLIILGFQLVGYGLAWAWWWLGRR
jgi:energy-coupling factor transporter transmembrane protein EcfT